MFFRWWRTRRRQNWKARPFPHSWEDVLQQNVFQYQRLATRDQARVRDYLQVFVMERHWEGCLDFRITDEVRVTIAAQVAILVLGLNDQYFDSLLSILVYPNAYLARETRVNRAGVVFERNSAREGEAWYGGPVILSWQDVLEGGRGTNGGVNIVFHEFAHQLDMLNGRVANGVPPINSAEQYRRWTKLMQSEFRRLIHDCQSDERPLFDCYGASHISEFFAVVTEAFLQLPQAMQARHPELYALFCEFYRQDPAARLE